MVSQKDKFTLSDHCTIEKYSAFLLDGFLNYEGKAWACNVKGSVYGGSAAFLENPFNPFFYQFYTWDKMIQAGQKAWSTGNVWDFFNYDFFHIYGYSNLDHFWGGKAFESILKDLFGVEENGTISVGSFLLDLTYLIPVGGAAAFLAKLGLSRLGLGLTERVLGKRWLEVIVNNKTLQLVSKELSKKWDKLKKLLNPYLKNFPVSGENLKVFWGYVVDGADLIGFKPSTWWKYGVRSTRLDGWISDSLGHSGNFMTKYYADFFKASTEGDVSYLAEITGKYLGLKNHQTIGAILTTFAGAFSIYGAYNKLVDAKKWVTGLQIKKTVKYKVDSVKKIVKSNPAVKASKVILKNTWKSVKPYAKRSAKKFIGKVEKVSKYIKSNHVVQKMKSTVKWVLKKPIVKKILNIKPVKVIIKTGKQIINTGKSLWNGLKKWAF
ncbi:hypothetical protein [Methanobacterium aggregans]|uniref:hypothetical protein n=1 Tax=Methanobacterium aggregans TaxID=1615586 RepID=UPI00320FB0BC